MQLKGLCSLLGYMIGKPITLFCTSRTDCGKAGTKLQPVEDYMF